jgi:glycosyltransferase involved in cell wall biosynthesis
MNTMNKKVSIVTITQPERFSALLLLKDMLSEQTGKKYIHEWVIVDGSKTPEDSIVNKENIDKLRLLVSYPIVYVESDGTRTIGHARNLGNANVSGDIIVCMDDDDYYFPQRIAHAVDSLNNSDKLIAGCSANCLYDYLLDRQFKSKGYGINHSTNNAMAYKKEYLLNHRYDDTKTFAEEPSFTNNFTEPMIQLDSNKTIIVSSHTINTFNKRYILVVALMGLNPQIAPMEKTVPNKYYLAYRSLFRKEEIVLHDIVYMCGCTSIDWKPDDSSLGGSEQAVVHLTSEWVKQGKKVAVYGKVPETQHNGVDYFPFSAFPYDGKFNVLVIWRLFGIASVMHTNISANKILWDLHDNPTSVQNIGKIYELYKSKITSVMFKSEYHQNEFDTALAKENVIPNKSTYMIVPNGIRLDIFEQNPDNVQRNKYRFCYCSCYTRGLLGILKYIWPVIYAAEPRAELHVYYGMNGVKDEQFKNDMIRLLATPGVMDHGRQGSDMINREKHMSTFQLYVTNSTSEIDCISVRESLVAGCIPVISTFGVFKNRDGIRFPITNDQEYLSIGHKLALILKNKTDDNLQAIRDILIKSKTIVSWKDVATEWMKLF